MQSSEIYTFARWYQTNVINSKLTSVLANSANTIKANLRNSIEVVKKQQLESIISTISQFNLNELNDSHRKIIKNIGLESAILEGAKSNFSTLLSPSMDNNHIINELTLYSNELNAAHSKIAPLITSLPYILSDDYLLPSAIPEGKYLMRLTFQEQASIDNLVNLKEWSKAWHTIARGFSMANDQSPEDFEIISVDKGSVIIDLALTLETITLINDTLSSFAELAINLTELYIALKSAKLLKDVITVELYEKVVKEAELNLTEKEINIVEKVVDNLEQNGRIKNKQSKNELTSAIREIVKFNDKGGDIKCISSTSKSNEEDVKIIENLNKSFIKLKNKSEIKLLEKPEQDKSK